MNLKDFSKESITRFGSLSYECGCGALADGGGVKIMFETGALDKAGQVLSMFLPPPSLVAVVTDPRTRAILDRRLEKRLSAAGYRVVTHIFDSQLSGSVNECGAATFPEDVRLVVGAGGAEVIDAAKYIARAHGADCAVLPTGASLCNTLNGLSRLLYGGVERLFETCAPKAVIVDTDLLVDSPANFTAAAFGELCSKLTALFDRYFSHLVSGEKFCPVFYGSCLNVIESAVRDTVSLTDDGRSPAPLIAEQCLKLSALSRLHDNSLPLIGADSQAARTLELLYRYEDREIRLKGENEFLFTRILLRVYRQILTSRPNSFNPPPDNNARIGVLTEYFGIDEQRAAEFIRPLASAAETRLYDYRLSEYRHELLVQLNRIDRLISQAWRPFKRLHEDDGYSLQNYLGADDIALCLAVAPDIQNNYTVLTYMKDAGCLDRFIV